MFHVLKLWNEAILNILVFFFSRLILLFRVDEPCLKKDFHKYSAQPTSTTVPYADGLSGTMRRQYQCNSLCAETKKNSEKAFII